jgi:hypothetical protein
MSTSRPKPAEIQARWFHNSSPPKSSGATSIDNSAEASATSTPCGFTVTKNVYDGVEWWGTIEFKNEGPARRQDGRGSAEDLLGPRGLSPRSWRRSVGAFAPASIASPRRRRRAISTACAVEEAVLFALWIVPLAAALVVAWLGFLLRRPDPPSRRRLRVFAVAVAVAILGGPLMMALGMLTGVLTEDLSRHWDETLLFCLVFGALLFAPLVLPGLGLAALGRAHRLAADETHVRSVRSWRRLGVGLTVVGLGWLVMAVVLAIAFLGSSGGISGSSFH